MRKTCLAALAAAGIAGPANADAPVNPIGPYAGLPTATASAMPAPAKPSWTERLMTPLRRNPFAATGGTPKPAAEPSLTAQSEPAIDPRSATPELFIGLAQMSHRAGNVAQARQYYQKALSLNPTHLEALLGAARMEDREGQLDVAQMLYQRTIATYPRNTTALNDLALCLARRGDLQGSRQVLEQAIQLEPQKPLFRNNIAKVMVELNLLDGAMKHLAAVHSPATANYNMGALLGDRGRNAEADEYFKKSLALDANFEPARAVLAQHGVPYPARQEAGSPALASNQPVGKVQSPDTAESILPTPEAVATIPWKPPVAALDYSTAPATPQLSAENLPALLPPVK
jgi:Tfp pilus assembly protein PilF